MPPSQTPLSPHRDNNFDLYRLVFAAMVLLAHSYELLDGSRAREPLTRLFGTLSFGELGVDFFFILSGYLISQSWRRDPDVARFLSKRVSRIYPGFLVAALVSGLAFGAFGSHDPWGYLHQVSVREYVKALPRLLLPPLPPSFEGSHHPYVNGSLWTIPYEFTCYLLVLAIGLVGAVRSRAVPVLVFAIAIGLTFVGGSVHLDDRVAYGSRLFAMFAGGMFLQASGLASRGGIRSFAVCAALLVVCLFSLPLAQPAVATLGAYCMVWSGLHSTRPRWLRRLPDISYGVYLYAWPIQKLVIAIGVAIPEAVFAIATALSIAAGLISWYGVEKPVMLVNARLLRRKTSLP